MLEQSFQNYLAKIWPYAKAPLPNAYLLYMDLLAIRNHNLIVTSFCVDKKGEK